MHSGLSGKDPAENKMDFDDQYPALARMGHDRPDQIKAYRDAYAMAREFRLKVVEPRSLEIDRKAMTDPAYVDTEVLRLACEYRLFSQMFPRMLGGQGFPFGAIIVGCEEIAASCVGIANLIFVNCLALACVSATLDLKWLLEFADIVCESEKAGAPRLLSTAITEPGAGSDVEDGDLVRRADLCCHARPVPGGYVLNGRKVFISNGNLADTHIVIAPTDPKRPAETTHSFRVRTGAEGFSVGRVERKMGQKACPAAELVFEDCFVPEQDRMSRESVYERGIDLALGATRGGVGAFGAGVARGAYERALNHCRTHELKGQPMVEHQWVQFKLTRMLQNVMAARQSYLEALFSNEQFGLLYTINHPALARMDALLPARVTRSKAFRRVLQKGPMKNVLKKLGDSLTPEAMRRASRTGATAKVLGTDLGMENCSLAIDLMGSDGIRHDRGMEKLYRDAKLLQIYEGTNQINTREIYKSFLGPPARV